MPSAIRGVVFDAGGTLFEVSEPVGETYARVARAHGFPVSAARAEAGFRNATAHAPPLAAPAGISAADRLAFERAWWREVVERTIGEALGDPDATRRRGAALARCFAELFAHYADPSAWRLFPDAAPVLQELSGRRFRLGVLSNFDGRLHGLIDGFGLGGCFSAVVASIEAGAAKPAGAAFAAIALGLQVEPSACLHVGDSLLDDACGAAAAGFRAAWLDRAGAAGANGAEFLAEARETLELVASAAPARLRSLAELPALVGSLG